MALRALCLVLSLSIWLIHYPALMSPDSIVQYKQALTGWYHDWHPPLPAFLLSLFLRSGLGLAGFTLVQCVTGLLGVRSLLQAVVEAVSGNPLTRRGAWGIALVIGLLVSPLSPLPFYLVTFWKDTLLTVVMLWLAVLLVRLLSHGYAGQPYRRAAAVAAVVVLAGALPLIRHNAAVMLPACSWALWRVTRAAWPSRLATAAAPLLVALVASVAIDRGLRVSQMHQGNVVLANDLVGVLVVDERAAADLKYTAANVLPEYRERFVFGAARLRPWGHRAVMTKGFVKNQYDPQIVDEYWRAIRHHPLALAESKTRAFLPLLGLTRTHYWFTGTICKNPFGLAQNRRFRQLRKAWRNLCLWIQRSPLRWIGGVHAVWIAVILVILWTSRRTPAGAVLALLGAVALSYYAGYWLATTAHDFRMMYPATLLTQVVAGSVLLARFAGRCAGGSVPRAPGGRGATAPFLVARRGRPRLDERQGER